MIPEDLAEAFGPGGGLLERLLGEVHRLPPVRAEEHQQKGLASPLVERLVHGHDVAERLGHLLVGETEDAVVGPDPGELVVEGTRLRELVLVMREDEVEPAAVDLEYRA